MLSKAQIKYIRSLTQQKYRKEHNVFIAEGDKIAREWLAGGSTVLHIAAVGEWLDKHHDLVARHPGAVVSVVSEEILASISTLHTPNQVLLVVAMPEPASARAAGGWTIALDTIQDPGNMGTIIRIADWFGIGQIICSPDCVDVYNPKVVQAAMGGHLRVRLSVAELTEVLGPVKIPVLAATLHGRPLHELQPFSDAVLLIGNESRGLQPSLVARAGVQVTIPGKGGAESLNAAVSAGIICSHLMPR